MAFIAVLKEVLVKQLATVLKDNTVDSRAESLNEMEQTLQKMLQEIGQMALSGWLEKQEDKYPVAVKDCECGGEGEYIRQREAVSISLQGKVGYRRAYYLCKCGRGQYPLDKRLGIAPGQMSDGVKTVAALLGVQAAYATGSTTLAQLLPLELSPNSIRAACHEVGDKVLREEAILLSACQDLQKQTATQRQQIPAERL